MLEVAYHSEEDYQCDFYILDMEYDFCIPQTTTLLYYLEDHF